MSLMGSKKKGKYGVCGDGRKVNILNKAEELSILSANNRVFAGVCDVSGDSSSWPAVGYEPVIRSFRFRRDIQAYLQSKVPSKPVKSHSKQIRGGCTTRFDPVPWNVLCNSELDLLLRIQSLDTQIDELIQDPPHLSPTPTVVHGCSLDLPDAVDGSLYTSLYDEYESLLMGPPLAVASLLSLDFTVSTSPCESDLPLRIQPLDAQIDVPNQDHLSHPTPTPTPTDVHGWSLDLPAAVGNSPYSCLDDEFGSLIKGLPLVAASLPSLNCNVFVSPCESDLLQGIQSVDSQTDELIHGHPPHPTPTPMDVHGCSFDLPAAADDSIPYDELESLIKGPALAVASSPSLDCIVSASPVDDYPYSGEYMAALATYAYDNGMYASEASSEFDYVLGWCF